MDREYLEREYAQASLEFAAAGSEADQWQARKVMAGIERTAAELFGFDFADSLHEKYCRKLQDSYQR